MKKSISFMLTVLLFLAFLVGCGSIEGEASVQSVALICGIGSIGNVNRFAGVISSGSETKIERNESFTIDELLVSVGEDVSVGDVLFTYDMEAGALDLEKAKLTLEQMRANLTELKKQAEDLEKQKEKATGSLELSVSLELRDVQTQITEAEYNVKSQENDIARMENSMQTAEVVSPVDGRIQSINENGGYDNYGNQLPFMSITATAEYEVKAYINEANIGQVMEGTQMIIRSRTDDTTWNGTVIKIDWENPKKNNNNYYYMSEDDTGISSSYPFYVEPDSLDGLLLGQHVYLEPYNSEMKEKASVMLPEWYINNADSTPWVWAEDNRGKLEKRNVKLGEYDELACTYEVLSGLTEHDCIAWPDESLKVGMTCIEFDESSFAAEGSSDGLFYEGGNIEEEEYNSFDMDGGNGIIMEMPVESIEPAVYENAYEE